MPRENEFYRLILERLTEYFGPNKNMLTCKDVAKYCGWGQEKTKRTFCIGSSGIEMGKLAALMSKL
jgi:hypothetical protein